MFSILGQISAIETIAEGSGIRDRPRLEKVYGKGNWKKKKGIASIKLETGEMPELKYTGTKRTESAKSNTR